MVTADDSNFSATILEILDENETRIKATLLADAGDFEELQSDWQERDSAAERNLREVEWSQYSSLNNELAEIEETRRRIGDGTYGVCEDCDDEIPRKRLTAVPTARKCISCQEIADKESGGRRVSL